MNIILNVTTDLSMVLFAVIAPQKAAPALASIRAWLAANNATIMTVVFAILGTSVIGKGIGAF